MLKALQFIVTFLVALSLVLPQTSEANTTSSKLQLIRLNKSTPKPLKGRLYCSRKGSQDIEVFIKNGKSVSTFKAVVKDYPLSLRKKINRSYPALREACQKLLIEKRIIIPPTATATPIQNENTPTPIPAPTFKLMGELNREIPRTLSNQQSSSTLTGEIQCQRCIEPFSIKRVLPTNEIISVQITNTETFLENGARLAFTLTAFAKDLLFGNTSVNFVAEYKGEEFLVEGALKISTISDEAQFPDGVFVSPTNGVDSLSQSGRADAPFLTLSYAISRAEQLFISSGSSPKAVNIFLDNGPHQIQSPIQFDKSKMKSNHTLAILPWNDAKPLIVLGTIINPSSWSFQAGKWINCGLTIPESSDLESEPFTFYIQGQSMVPARFPNSGFLTANSLGSLSFTLNQSFPNTNGKEFRTLAILYKTTSTANGSTITLSEAGMSDRIKTGSSVYLEGIPEFLDGVVTNQDNSQSYEYALDTIGGQNCLVHNYSSFSPNSQISYFSLPQQSNGIHIFNHTSNDYGAIVIRGLQFIGGSSARRYGYMEASNPGHDDVDKAIVFIESSPSNIEFSKNVFGPTALSGITGIRYLKDINIFSNVFTEIAGVGVYFAGVHMRELPTLTNVIISDNVFSKTNPMSLVGSGVSVARAGAVHISNNYFSGLFSGGISVAGDRYYYTALKWCMLSQDQGGLGLSEADCKNPSVVSQKLSWDDSQGFNPTREITIENNFINDGLYAVKDTGYIYLWGIPHGGPPSSVECVSDPDECSRKINVTVKKNFILNRRPGSQELALVYRDDGANSVDIKDNILVSPQGSAYPVYAKGRGGEISNNLILNSEESKTAMVSFAEFQATSNISQAPFLDINKELNREISITNNAFIQMATGNPISEKIADFYYFSNWEPDVSDGYGNLLSQSENNIFFQTPKATQTTAMRWRKEYPGNNIQLFGLQEWRNAIWSQSRRFDQNSVVLNSIFIPTTEGLLNGALPSAPELNGIISRFHGEIFGTMNFSCNHNSNYCPDKTQIISRSSTIPLN